MAHQTAFVVTHDGRSLTIPLEPSERPGCTLTIDGVRYHFERVPRELLTGEYCVDTDPDYVPRADASGCCYVLAPYSE